MAPALAHHTIVKKAPIYPPVAHPVVYHAPTPPPKHDSIEITQGITFGGQDEKIVIHL